MKSGSTTMTESEREATRRRLQIWQEAQPLLSRNEANPLLELRGDPEILVRFGRLHSMLQRRLG